MNKFRLNGYEQELLNYLKANPESKIFTFKNTYWCTYIWGSRQNITMSMVNKFRKYSLIDVVNDGHEKKEFRLSEKGKNYGS